MKSTLSLLVLILLLSLIKATPLTNNSIAALDQVYPRCFTQNGKVVKTVEEVEGLFAKKLKVTLG